MHPEKNIINVIYSGFNMSLNQLLDKAVLAGGTEHQ